MILGEFLITFPALYLFTTQGHCRINPRNNKGQTPLALAVSEAYSGMIDLLIEHGANVNADDEDGETQAVGSAGLRKVREVRILINGLINWFTDWLASWLAG